MWRAVPVVCWNCWMMFVARLWMPQFLSALLSSWAQSPGMCCGALWWFRQPNNGSGTIPFHCPRGRPGGDFVWMEKAQQWMEHRAGLHHHWMQDEMRTLAETPISSLWACHSWCWMCERHCKKGHSPVWRQEQHRRHGYLWAPTPIDCQILEEGFRRTWCFKTSSWTICSGRWSLHWWKFGPIACLDWSFEIDSCGGAGDGRILPCFVRRSLHYSVL